MTYRTSFGILLLAGLVVLIALPEVPPPIVLPLALIALSLAGYGYTRQRSRRAAAERLITRLAQDLTQTRTHLAAQTSEGLIDESAWQYEKLRWMRRHLRPLFGALSFGEQGYYGELIDQSTAGFTPPSAPPPLPADLAA